MVFAQQQRGMTMWSLIFVLAVLGFTLFVGFKLIPVYLNDMKVKSAVQGLGTETRGQVLTYHEIVIALDKRFQIDDIQRVDLKKHLIIQARGGQRDVSIAYEVVIPLFGNISILIDFEHHTLISGGA